MLWLLTFLDRVLKTCLTIAVENFIMGLGRMANQVENFIMGLGRIGNNESNLFPK
jgi:hypothetical protein